MQNFDERCCCAIIDSLLCCSASRHNQACLQRPNATKVRMPLMAACAACMYHSYHQASHTSQQVGEPLWRDERVQGCQRQHCTKRLRQPLQNTRGSPAVHDHCTHELPLLKVHQQRSQGDWEHAQALPPARLHTGRPIGHVETMSSIQPLSRIKHEGSC
jgi:hypothetical protein